MTAAEIALRLVTKAVTPARLRKAQKLAERSQVEWAEVLAQIAAYQKVTS